jgi:hypothetical protein
MSIRHQPINTESTSQETITKYKGYYKKNTYTYFHTNILLIDKKMNIIFKLVYVCVLMAQSQTKSK